MDWTRTNNNCAPCETVLLKPRAGFIFSALCQIELPSDSKKPLIFRTSGFQSYSFAAFPFRTCSPLYCANYNICNLSCHSTGSITAPVRVNSSDEILKNLFSGRAKTHKNSSDEVPKTCFPAGQRLTRTLPTKFQKTSFPAVQRHRVRKSLRPETGNYLFTPSDARSEHL